MENHSIYKIYAMLYREHEQLELKTDMDDYVTWSTYTSLTPSY